MFIHEMTPTECRQALNDAIVARLACASDNQPYVVPISFALDREYIYSFATLGQKIQWMRENQRVCVEVDDYKTHDRWHSVIVFGRYEELPNLPQYEAARLSAYKVLGKRVMWWEPAAVSVTHRDTAHSLIPIFFRIRIERITGHRASPDSPESERQERPQPSHRHWWSYISHR